MTHAGHNIYCGFETAAVARDAIRVDAPNHGQVRTNGYLQKS